MRSDCSNENEPKFTAAKRAEEYLKRVAASLAPSKTTMALTFSQPGAYAS